MWIFTTDGFFSVVSKGCRPDQLMVRARVRADLKRAFPKAVIKTSPPPADYRYRVIVTRKAVLTLLARTVEKLAYANFKDTVRDTVRHDAYIQVWNAMFALQENGRPPMRAAARASADIRRIHPGNYDEQPPARGLFDDIYDDAGLWHPNKRRSAR